MVADLAEAKCIVKLSKASNLCETLISKEFLVMISLLDELEGLRVSDIHFLLGGNKSWVSNLCSRLARAGLASSKRKGREVYYKLTNDGEEVAQTALTLVKSLIKTDALPYKLSANTYIFYKNSLSANEKVSDYFKLGFPCYTHKGAVLFNQSDKNLLFVGNDRNGKPFILEIFINSIQLITIDYDEFYKRRNSPLEKPLKVRFSVAPESQACEIVYFFTQYHRIGRSTENPTWFKLIQDAKIKLLQDKKETLVSEPEEDMMSLIK